jgi:hypothetical protein
MARPSSDQAHPVKTGLRSPALDNPLANLPRPIHGRRSRRRTALRVVLVAALVAVALGAGAIWQNAFGVGEKFDHLVARIELMLNPPPDRPTAPTVEVPLHRTDPPDNASLPPDEEGSPEPSAVAAASASTAPKAKPSPTAPVRRRVDVNIVPSPNKVFASEIKDDMCAAAGVQSALAILKLGNTSDSFQRELESRIGEWDSYRDSHNGGWGPSAMVNALAAYGGTGYQVRAYGSRSDAIFDAALAIRKTHKPVLLLAWRGAHTWVMTGYRASGDPAIFQDASIGGTYIIDPWYPRISSIWGPSDPPGTFQDQSEMRRNYLPWKRPEGLYPDRDGKWIAVVPTTR